MSAALETERVTRAMLAAVPTKPRRKRKNSRFGRHWTKEEDAILMREWGEVGVRVMRGKLPGRSWGAIRARAVGKLKLPLGAPQGYVCIKRAAEILGYGGEPSVLRLAERQGVAVRNYPFPCDEGPRISRRKCVSVDEITEALAREIKGTEHVAGAAAARDLCPASLWRWLKAAGALPEKVPGRKQRGAMHIPTEVIDRVVRERSRPTGSVTVLELGRKIGVDPSTASRWLARIGVRIGRGFGRGVTPEQVAQVTALFEARRRAA